MSAEPPTPGEVLRNWLGGRDWKQKTLSEVIGRPDQWTSEVINGKKSITAESAAQLGAALGTSPDYWLLLQYKHRLWVLAQDKQHNRRLGEIRARAELAGRRERA